MAKYLRKPKVNIPMYTAAVLFCLTVISTYFVSGLYARYTTSGTGSDSARVIQFRDITITETGEFVTGDDGVKNDLMIIPGVDITKKAVVDFGGSESATYVFVEVGLTGDWETTDNKTFTIGNNYLTWTVADGWTYLDGSKYVYYKELAPNVVLDDVDIIKDDKITVSDAITKATITDLRSTITFRASAVQSNGFDNAAAAWASLSSKGGVSA